MGLLDVDLPTGQDFGDALVSCKNGVGDRESVLSCVCSDDLVTTERPANEGDARERPAVCVDHHHGGSAVNQPVGQGECAAALG